MSMFEDKRYRWRETYFVLFRHERRPTLVELEKAVAALNPGYRLCNVTANEDGTFDSVSVVATEDFAALDICYCRGEEVAEQVEALAEELRPAACEAGQDAKLSDVRRADARFDVLHFEQIADMEVDDEFDEMLDPSALLLVIGALAELTDGVAVDPQSATILGEDGHV